MRLSDSIILNNVIICLSPNHMSHNIVLWHFHSLWWHVTATNSSARLDIPPCSRWPLPSRWRRRWHQCGDRMHARCVRTLEMLTPVFIVAGSTVKGRLTWLSFTRDPARRCFCGCLPVRDLQVSGENTQHRNRLHANVSHWFNPWNFICVLCGYTVYPRLFFL